MPAEFNCPNGHLVIHGGPGDDGVHYNCGRCYAEGRAPYTFDLPEHLRQRDMMGQDTSHPVEIRTVAVPEGAIRIQLPGQMSGEDAKADGPKMITVRELSDQLGISDLRTFIPKLQKAGVDIRTGGDLVPASLKDKIELVPAGA